MRNQYDASSVDFEVGGFDRKDDTRASERASLS